MEEKVVIGVDIGGSTTKICGFSTGAKELIAPIFIKASDQTASIYGALGKFCSDNAISLDQVEKIYMTGVGSTFINKPLYGIPTRRVAEFNSIGLGGIYLSGLPRAIVVSMGTGTAIVKAEGDECEHLGGTGVGGGTLTGLSKRLLGMEEYDHIIELAASGNLSNVDLWVEDIMSGDRGGLPAHMTASNFGRVSDVTSRADLALGIINMVFETAGMMGVFASKKYGIKDIVVTGILTTIPQSRPLLNELGRLQGMNFIIPDMSQFGTVIGSALHYYKTGYRERL